MTLVAPTPSPAQPAEGCPPLYDEGNKGFFHSRQLTAHYEVASRAIWLRMTPEPRPCFNPELLRDLNAYCRLLTKTAGSVSVNGDRLPIECAVFASGVPGVFNLGGDLDLFTRLIEARDRDGLSRYGLACVTAVYRNHIGHDIPVQTISLVQGDCLGGGFEAALSSDVVISERSSRFGCPEILFNLFPGMGACSLLERRVGGAAAQSILAGGKTLSADEALRLGVIDKVVEDGEGEEAVRLLLDENRRARNGLLGITRARKRVSGVTLEELTDVVHIWVEHALRLTPRDLKLMQRLVLRQNQMAEGTGKARAAA